MLIPEFDDRGEKRDRCCMSFTKGGFKGKMIK